MKAGQVPRGHHPYRVLAAASAVFTALWTVLGALSDWGAYWVAWLLAGFLVPELYGLLVNPALTLSENTWALEHLDFGHPFDLAEWQPLHWLVALAVWGLAVWLSGHLPFGIWRLGALPRPQRRHRVRGCGAQVLVSLRSGFRGGAGLVRAVAAGDQAGVPGPPGVHPRGRDGP